MKMRLFSTLASTFVLSTAIGLADSYTIPIPTGSSLIANQLDHGSNTLDEVLSGATNGTRILKYNCNGTYTTNTMVAGVWTPAGGTLKPGEGAFIVNSSGATFSLTFTGTPHVPVLPAVLPCGCGAYNCVSRQTTNNPSTFFDIMGFAPPDGTTLLRWNGVAFTTYTFFGGDMYDQAFNLVVLDVHLGEAVFINVPACSSAPTFTCATNKTVNGCSAWSFDAPTNITVSCYTNAALTFTTLTNSGPCPLVTTRTWVIRDVCGNSNTCSQTVTVNCCTNSAPVITAQPVSQTVLEGQTATLSLTATGTATLVYQWRRGTTNLTDGGNISGAVTATLTLSNAAPNQTGTNYSCVVTNGAGSVTSRFTALTVLADNDRDGMADYWEKAYGFNTNNAADALLDNDGDGIINRLEFQQGTNPTNAASKQAVRVVAYGTNALIGLTLALPAGLAQLSISNYLLMEGSTNIPVVSALQGSQTKFVRLTLAQKLLAGHTYTLQTDSPYSQSTETPNAVTATNLIFTDCPAAVLTNCSGADTTLDVKNYEPQTGTIVWSVFIDGVNNSTLGTSSDGSGNDDSATFTIPATLLGATPNPHEIRIRAVDGNGNYPFVECTNYVWMDTQPPTITCPSTLTVQCDSQVPAALPFSGTVSDDLDPAPVVTLLSENISGVCPKTITRQYVATDACGNTNVCSWTITVQDTTPPAVTTAQGANATIECPATPSFTAPTFTDACAGAINPSVVTVTNTFGCTNIITRTWTATDPCGNTTNRSQVITVADTTRPAVTTAQGANATIECPATPSFTAPVFTDACAGVINPGVVTVTNTIGCTNIVTRTWTATDPCGNSTNRSQAITIVDTTRPAVTTAQGANATIECPATPVFTAPVFTDLCAGVITPSSVTVTNTIGCTNIVTRTWTATDPCGNTTNRSQAITIVDTTPPAVTTAQGANATIECPAAPSFTAPIFTDACAGVINPSVVTVTNTIGCTNIITRTWTATDPCGNSTNRSQVITVADTTRPAVTTAQGANATIECPATPSFTAPVFTDACAGIINPGVVTVTNKIGCTNIVTRTWTATDPCGNTTNRSQAITIVDTTPPAVTTAQGANATIECPAAPSFTAPVFTDACAGVINPSVVTVTNTIGCTNIVTRTWTATDPCGNSTNRSQAITVVDTTRPAVTTAQGANATIECPAAPSFTAPVFTDACAGVINPSVVTVTNTIGCTNIVTRTWTATDPCGNTTNRSQAITIVDTTRPAVTTAQGANATIECPAVPSFTAPVFTDACAGVITPSSVTVTNTLGCTNIVTRTWTATDPCGNSTNRSQVITIVDTTTPAVTTSQGSNATIECPAVPSFTAPVFTDLCAGVITPSVVTVTNTFGCTNIITRTWTATDPCGNSTNRSQVITVVDTTRPAVTTAQGANATIECPTAPVFSAPVFTDLCAGVITPSVVTVTNTIGCTNIITRTWTASDGCGNTTNRSQVITMNCCTNPCIISMTCATNSKTVSCGTNWDFDAPTNIVNNCCTNYSLTVSTFTNNAPCPLVVTRTWRISDVCGNTNTCSQTVTVNCCTNYDTNCCANCTSNNYVSYTNTIYPGYNFLANHLCQGTNNSVNSILTGLVSDPNGVMNTVLEIWNGQGYTSYQYFTAADAASYFGGPAVSGWYDTTFGLLASATLLPGEGFVLQNNSGTPYTVVIRGCPPTCPPPCVPTNGLSLVGRLGIGTATWTDLFSCPPPCGARMTVWNVNSQSFTDYNYDNLHGWLPPAPVLQIGQSVFVSVQPNTNCLPCTNNLVVNGGFEQTSPAVAPNSTSYLTPPNGLPGWTTTTGNTLEVWGNTLLGIPAAAGTNHMEINSESNDQTVWQVLTNLNTNCLATFFFNYTGRFGIVSNTYNNDFTVTLSTGNTVSGDLLSVDLDPATWSVGGWTNFTFGFYPPPTVTIAFRGHPHYVNGIYTQGGAHIDNVLFAQCCNTNPCITMICTGEKTVPCSTNWVFDAPINIVDNCCSNYSVAFSAVTNSGPCPLVIIGTWLVSDACGNSAACSQKVTVTNTPPTITSYPNGGNLGCNPTNLPTDSSIGLLVTTAGACGIITTVTHVDGGTACVPIRTFTITVSNACGSAMVTNLICSWMNNTNAPVITPSFTNLTVYTCSNSALVFFGASATSACCTNVTIFALGYGGSSGSASMGHAFGLGTTTVEWVATDCCGNTATSYVTITVTNPPPPVITGFPTGGNLNCNPTNLPTDSSIMALVTTTAGYSVTTNVTHVDTGTACSPTRTFTITVSNACGIVVMTNVVYAWTVDTTPPTLTCSSNKTVNCGTNWNFDTPAATDNCSGTNVTLTFSDVTNSFFCPLVFTRTWTATDLCGNTNTCSQTVTVINTTLPVFTNCPASTDLGCNPTNIPDRDPNVRAINGCGPATIPSYLLVSSYNTSQVRRYDGNTGAPINSGIFVLAGSGGLSSPGGLAFGVDGNLYVCSRFTSDVKRYNGTTGAPIGTGLFASGNGLVQPVALVFGPDGNLYVSNGGSNNVVRYNGTTGAFIDIFASGVSNPQGVVFGPDGNLYVSSFTTSEVKSYVGPLNPSPGTLIGAFFLAGSGGLNGPVGLVFGPDGNLYVSSDNTHNVKRYAGPLSVSPNPAPGTFLGDFVSLVSAGSGGLVEPLGLVFGPDGNLYVCDRSSAMVKRYNGTMGAFINNFASGPAGFPLFTPSAPVITSTKMDATNGCSRLRTITYTAVDTCGNSNTCTQLITWTVDITPPVITGSYAAVTLGCNPASLPTDAVLKAQVTATDNCGLAFTNVTHVDGGTLCASNRTFTITVTDACGNAAVTNVVYTWTIDHTPPVITIAPTTLNLNCNPAAASLPTDAYVTTLVRATDNCSLASTNVTHVDGGTACASNRTFTITVRDGCTNSASTNLVYTWKVDHTVPSITCLTNKIIVRLNTNCQLVIPPVGVKASDNCTPASQLVFKQSPTNGTIMLAKQAYVTVTVYDACGNSNSCTALVIGQDQLGPVVSGPTTLTVTNCLMPNVTNLVTAYDNCCPQSSLKKIQSPAPNTPLGPGIYSVTVTVSDCNGNSTPWKIQLTVSPTESFLTNLFNTGVSASRALQPIGAVDPHYTLGPVAAGTAIGAGNYNAPNAIVTSNFWTLPPTYPSGKSAWIAPSTNKNGYPKGYYVYTNQFTLPVTADAASASISGRWTADNGAKMYFNGSATPIATITAPNGYTKWSPFTISGGFLPNLNTILFVVSNSPSGLFGSGTSITGLRVEYTNAVANCYNCAPPAVINISTPQTVPQHGGVTFYVAASGTPPLSYQWFYNGVALQDISPYSGVNSDTLFIKPVDYPLAGAYTVTISNPCGNATAKTKLSVSRGLAWASGVWNVAQLDNPLAASIGPDLNLVGTSDYGMNYTITAGTTEDFELPARGGQVVNVMHVAPLPLDTSIQIPLIAPPGNNSVNSYTLIMDLYQPASSAGTPSTLCNFDDHWCCPTGQDGEALTVDAQNMLHLTGSAVGVPYDVVSTVPLPIGAWSRVAVVVDDSQDGVGLNLFLYLNGQPVGSLYVLTPTGLPIDWSHFSPTLLSRQTNDVSLNGEFYVSSIQFHAVALAPQDIVGMGSPDAGPAPLNESVAGPQPVLAAAVVNGTISFSWTGDLFVLQETTDLTGGDWTDSMLPFTESEVDGDIITVAHPNPQDGPARFYRLIFRP